MQRPSGSSLRRSVSAPVLFTAYTCITCCRLDLAIWDCCNSALGRPRWGQREDISVGSSRAAPGHAVGGKCVGGSRLTDTSTNRCSRLCGIWPNCIACCWIGPSRRKRRSGTMLCLEAMISRHNIACCWIGPSRRKRRSGTMLCLEAMISRHNPDVDNGTESKCTRSGYQGWACWFFRNGKRRRRPVDARRYPDYRSDGGWHDAVLKY